EEEAEPTEEATTEEAEEPTEEATTEEAEEPTEEAAAEGGRTLEEVCAEYEGTEVPEDFNVGLVTDIGRIDDGTFNEFAYEGMQAAADCLGLQTDYVETASEADYEQNISTILQSDPE